MIILTIRTDKPEAEIGLFEDGAKLAYETWHAHRELAETIHKKIADLLAQTGKELKDVQGIVAFQGPGSFTGLRIGLTVGNALAYAENIPIVAAQTVDWIRLGTTRLQNGETDKIALPEYGAEANITQPRK